MLDRIRDQIAREWRSFIDEAIRPGPLERTPEEREVALVKRASDATPFRAILENAPFMDFLANQEARLVHELTALPLEDDAGRRNLAVAIQAQRQWVKYLLAAAQDGRAAEAELERLRKGGRAYF